MNTYDPIELMLFIKILIFVSILSLILNYFIFKKFGDIEAWKGLIPIYSTILLFERYYGSGWYFLLSLIPIVNIWFSFGLYYRLSKSFGKDLGWFIITQVIFGPLGLIIIAFDSSKYKPLT